MSSAKERIAKPKWLRAKLPSGPEYGKSKNACRREPTAHRLPECSMPKHG